MSEAERVAEFLVSAGASARAYTGATPAPEREQIEAALDDGSLACVVATSALGMGYDNPRLSYVIHLGSPSSPIAYYQQVGRAGRGSVEAQVVLVPTPTESDIWAYFDSTSMPPASVVDEVLGVLEAAGPSTVAELEGMVNLRRGRLEALLKILDVDGAVDRDGSKWLRTSEPWVYDTERYAQLAASRAAEQAAMRDYQRTDRCRLEFLREQLDDAGAEPCGRCDNCTGRRVATEIDRGRRGRGPAVPPCGDRRHRASQAVAAGDRGAQRQHRAGSTCRRGSGARVRQRPRLVRGPRAAVLRSRRSTRRRADRGVSPRRSRRGRGVSDRRG